MEILTYLMENIGFPLLVAIVAIYIERYISEESNNK